MAWQKRKFRSKKSKKYSSSQRKAYYIGLGVGLTGSSSTGSHRTSKVFLGLSDAEARSYMAGYKEGSSN